MCRRWASLLNTPPLTFHVFTTIYNTQHAGHLTLDCELDHSEVDVEQLGEALMACGSGGVVKLTLRLAAVPFCVGAWVPAMTRLRELHLSANKCSFDTALTALTALRKLSLRTTEPVQGRLVLPPALADLTLHTCFDTQLPSSVRGRAGGQRAGSGGGRAGSGRTAVSLLLLRLWPPQLSALTQLTSLALRDMNERAVPTSYSALVPLAPTLKKLKLHSCELQSCTLGALSGLETLNLQNVLAKDADDLNILLRALPQLKVLTAWDVHLSFPAALTALTQLKTLSWESRGYHPDSELPAGQWVDCLESLCGCPSVLATSFDHFGHRTKLSLVLRICRPQPELEIIRLQTQGICQVLGQLTRQHEWAVRLVPSFWHGSKDIYKAWTVAQARSPFTLFTHSA